MGGRFPDRAPFDEARARGERAPDGRPLCRFCGGSVPRPATGWCSMKCVDAWKLINDPQVQRAAVWKRDGGRCRCCLLDIAALAALLQGNGKPERQAASRRNARMGARPEALWSESGLWDLDHILPVQHGGGACGIENLQLLCIWCHKEKTAEQARGRRRDRQPQAALPLQDA